jgi:hypothetical protein
VLAYPGVWVRSGVYATHGHYLDAHLTVPTLERLAVGAVERLLGGLPAGRRSPDDYETVQAPLYSFLYGLAQGGERTRRVAGANASARVWALVHGRDGRPPTRRGRIAGRIAVPSAIRLARRFGIGPLSPDLSAAEIGRAGVRAIGEVLTRLGVEAAHVIFGHTHRPGPRDEEHGWSSANGARLVNTGSWVYAPGILGHDSRDSDFWPGTAVVVEDEGAPELRQLLAGHGHAELRSRL